MSSSTKERPVEFRQAAEAFLAHRMERAKREHAGNRHARGPLAREVGEYQRGHDGEEDERAGVQEAHDVAPAWKERPNP